MEDGRNGRAPVMRGSVNSQRLCTPTSRVAGSKYYASAFWIVPDAKQPLRQKTEPERDDRNETAKD